MNNSNPSLRSYEVGVITPNGTGRHSPELADASSILKRHWGLSASALQRLRKQQHLPNPFRATDWEELITDKGDNPKPASRQSDEWPEADKQPAVVAAISHSTVP